MDYVIANSKFNGANLSNTNFTGVNLSGNDFSSKKDAATGYVNTSLGNANLSNANLSGADLSGVVLTGANVTNTDFTGAVLDGVVSGSLGGAPLVLPERWHLMRGYLVGPKASLVGAQLNNLDMSFWDFSGANLTSVNFYGSSLYNASFVGSKAVNVNLDRSNLTGANFTDADLTGAILNWARISVTNFTRAKLINVTRGCYDGWVCDWSGYPEFAFSGAILTGVKSWNFSPNYRFNAFLPAGWTNRYGVLFGPTADLSGLILRQIDLTGLNLSNANLTGVDLSGSNLSGSDLSNAVLTGVISGAVTGTPTLPAGWSLVNGYLVGPGAKLANASLAKANLFGLDLSGVDFTNTNLAGANLWGANLTNTNLTNANLSKVKLDQVISSGVIGSPILPSGWSVVDGVLVGPDAQLPALSSLVGSNLSNRDFTGFNFSGLNLSGVNFSGSILTNTNLSNANLSGANLSGAVLTATNLSRAVLTGANVSGVDLSSADISFTKSGGLVGVPAALPADWLLIRGYFFGSSANLSDANLSGVDFSKLDLTKVTLSGANLAGADLRGLQLAGVSMSGLNLSGANLAGANLAGANLSSANLSGADLSGVVLTGANVTNTDFTGAVLSGVVTGSLGGAPLVLPERWHLIRGYLVGPKASLIGADLNRLNLRGWDFSGANLKNAYFWGADLAGASFVGSTLTNANFEWVYMAGANFTDTDLTGASLTWATISDTNFTRAKLINVTRGCADGWACDWGGVPFFTFAGAILTGVKSWNFSPNYRFNAFLPAGWTNRYGVLFGPTADLSGLILRQIDLTGLNLSNANLTGVDLSGSNLSGSDLSNAVLTGVISGAVTGTPTLPAGWSLVNGYLVGPGAKLANASLAKANLFGLDLSGVDFTNTNLAGANLWGANLTNTNLTNANLEGVDITSANVRGAIFTGASVETLIGTELQGAPAGLPTGWSISNGTFGRTISLFGVRITGTPEVGQTLTVAPTTTPNGAALTYTWFRDSVEISGETSNQHLVTLADIGAQITVRVAATKAGYWSTTQDSTALLVPSTFNALTRVQLTGSGTLGSVITLNASGKSGISSLKYQASRDGGQTWINVTGNTYQLTFEDLGLTLQFRVIQGAQGYQTQTTTVGSIAVASSVSLPGYSAGRLDSANSFASLGTLTSPGSRLVATKTQWSSNVRVSGFWFSSDGGAISTKSSYIVALTDVGATIRYVEVGVAPDGSVSYRISAPLVAKANTFDSSASPKITGTLVMGSRLKATVENTWSPGTKYTYQWLLNGVAIPGEKTQNYVLGVNQVGNSVNVRVCGSKAGFETKCETSLQGGVVAKGTLVATADPSITTSAAKVGAVIRGNPGKWVSGTAFTFRWLRDGIEIPGLAEATYIVTKDDSRHSISFKVTASKPGYSDVVKISAPKLIN